MRLPLTHPFRALFGGALLAAASSASLAGCVAPPAASAPGEPAVVETRRVFYPGDEERVKRLYRVLVHPDGLVEQHGDETEWYESGGVKAKREFRHGEPTGVWETWFEGGTQRSRVVIGDGQTPEPIVWWHENGALAGEGSGIAGVKEGAWTFWYPSGARSSVGSFENGARTGEWTFWFEDGTKRAQGEYADGQRVGRWQLWDEAGDLVLKQALPASAEPPESRNGERVERTGAEPQ